MSNFYLNYIAQWPFVLAFALPTLLFAGWAGRTMALRILSNEKKDSAMFWLAVLFIISTYLISKRWW